MRGELRGRLCVASLAAGMNAGLELNIWRNTVGIEVLLLKPSTNGRTP